MLRNSEREALARLSASERVALAFDLGRRDLESYAASRGFSLAEARRALERRRQARRTPSACIEALLS
ncbi:MAG: hypothetical protein DCC71_11020 [Proteobacteria bacterium]|nr:MAG: hypothetical protein DCC71_11020 [Pseudomonadota bacterium]